MSDSVVQYPPLRSDDPAGNSHRPAWSVSPVCAIGLVGDTYTITVSGKETDGRFCLINIHFPQGGGPGRTVTISKRPSSFSRDTFK